MKKSFKRILLVAGVLLLAVMIPLAAMAEQPETEEAAMESEMTTESAAQPEAGRAVIGKGGMKGTTALNTSELTDEQKAAYEDALKLYEDVEDEVLKDLIEAGALTQEDVDAYQKQRDEKSTDSSVDMSNWTAEQYKAYYEARSLSGDERQQAIDKLVESGQLTQAQADALFMGNTSESADIHSKIMQSDASISAINKAFSTLKQAQSTFIKTLSENGIMTRGGGMSIGGNTMGRGGKGQMQNGGMQSSGGKGQAQDNGAQSFGGKGKR